MKVGLARLKMLTFKAPITAFVMTTALIQMKHGCMGVGFVQQIMLDSQEHQDPEKVSTI